MTDEVQALQPKKRGSWLLKALVAVAVVLAALAILVALQPAEFQISRSARMAAPPSAPFAQVNDFHNWDAWSPWARLDPEMKQTYEGEAAGKGAIYTWAGNAEVGEGRMTIVESQPNERVRVNLEFLKPFAATSTADFTFRPEGDQTLVTWTMNGTNGFVAKAFGLLVDMDGMVGGQFEQGLASMKSVVESQAGSAPEGAAGEAHVR
jgi:hypothetical protein